MRARAVAGDVSAQQHFTQTRYAHLFGPRNSDLGMVFYALVYLASSTGLIRRSRVRQGLLLGSALSVATSLYLLWALVGPLRVWCSICMRGHAVNFATFALLLRLSALCRDGRRSGAGWRRSGESPGPGSS